MSAGVESEKLNRQDVADYRNRVAAIVLHFSCLEESEFLTDGRPVVGI